jgi:hypothetical protein
MRNFSSFKLKHARVCNFLYFSAITILEFCTTNILMRVRVFVPSKQTSPRWTKWPHELFFFDSKASSHTPKLRLPKNYIFLDGEAITSVLLAHVYSNKSFYTWNKLHPAFFSSIFLFCFFHFQYVGCHIYLIWTWIITKFSTTGADVFAGLDQGSC